MYELPQFNLQKNKNKIQEALNSEKFRRIFILVISIIAVFGVVVYWTFYYFPKQAESFLQKINFSQEFQGMENVETETENTGYVSEISYEQAIINAVKGANDSVVSIVISKDLPTYEQQWVNPFGDGSMFNIQVPQYVQNGTEYKEVGSGSGFVVSANGLILTNKHVVLDKDADYTILTNDGEKYSATILATDPVQDLALIKINDTNGKSFQPLKLGDSSEIQLGQTAIAIGNTLGEFSNTVSVGVISGLSRTILASDTSGANSETLEDVIQTDAAINSGNSGGPLLNLKGEVIGINTAIAQDAQSVAFAIPINYAKKDIEQVVATNKIVYPFLGVRYILVDDDVKKEYELSVDYGALISNKGVSGSAVTADSPAQKAGLKSGDIILELNGEKVTTKETLAKIIQKYNAGDTVTLKILSDEVEKELSVVLAERKE